MTGGDEEATALPVRPAGLIRGLGGGIDIRV
jgi:hypothetical protein